VKVPQGVKRCKCRDGDGRELGARCPKLKRKDGSWNPGHGTWQAVSYLPAVKGQERARLRAGGFATQADLARWFTDAHALLEVPEEGPAGHAARTEILALIQQSRDDGSPLPALEDIRRRHATGAAYAPGETGAYLLAWLAGHEGAGHWTATTARSYRRAVERLFLPAFGTVPLDKLSSKHILDMFAGIDRESARIAAARLSPDPETRKSVAGMRPAGPSTKRRILAVIRSALGDAVSPEERLLTVNVADGVSFGRRQKGRGASRMQPRLWTPEREAAWREDFGRRSRGLGPRGQFEAWRAAPFKPGPVMVWRQEQAGRFLDAAASHRMYPLFCVLAYLALRRSEGCGLKWTETDLAGEEPRLLVGESTLVQIGAEVIEQDEAKTQESKDWVTVPPEVSVPVLAWRMQQDEERRAWGSAWTDTGHCFTWESGEPYDPEQVSGAFERIAFGAGLPPVTLRDIRHCLPTYALADGADIKVVSSMMRHSSVKITADIYALVLPDLAAAVSRSVAGTIPRRSAPGAARNL
jgi:Phage integrase family